MPAHRALGIARDEMQVRAKARLLDETELPGGCFTAEQIHMATCRYGFATSHAGKRVLEVGCGPAVGLGLMSRQERWVVGVDVTVESLLAARRHYGTRARLVAADAHRLPFRHRCFDTVLLFEVIYYFEKPEQVLGECRRVITPGGNILVCTPNPDLPGFHPSPLGRRYFSASELLALLETHGFRPEIFGAFPVSMNLGTYAILARTRYRVARGLDRVPGGRSVKGLLNRTLLGKSNLMEPEITERPDAFSLEPITPGNPVGRFRVLYAIGRT